MNGLRVASMCTGYGGLDDAVMSVLGGELVWVADNDPGAAKILAHHFPSVPNLGDITTVDWAAVEPVDILTTGFPCTDVSCAGARAGLRAGTRSGVWTYCARAISQLRPSLVVIENVRGLLSAGADSPVEPCPWCLGETGDEHALRGAGAVFGDLADIGYDAEWATVSAADAGAPHRRERVFILARPTANATVSGRMGRGSRHLAGSSGAPVAAQRPGWLPAQHDGLAGEGSATAEDADRAAGSERWLTEPGEAEGGRPRADTGGSGGAPTLADAPGDGWNEGRTEPARLVGGSDAAVGGDESCPSCGCGVYCHDAGGFCAGLCGGNCVDPELGRPDGGWNSFEDDADPADVRAYALAHSAGIRHGDAGPQGERGLPATALSGAPADADGGGRRLGRGPGRQGRESQQLGLRPAEHQPGDIAWGAYEPAVRRWEHATGRSAPRPTEPGRTGERLSPRFVEWLMGLPEGWVTDVPGLSRNAQLKALGNGVVPQQAAMALRLLLSRTWTREAA